jgi:hypothetical protein
MAKKRGESLLVCSWQFSVLTDIEIKITNKFYHQVIYIMTTM